MIFVEEVAKRKLNAPADWRMFAWELVGKTNDVIITGGVPVGEYKKGPRKGNPKWEMPGEKVVVTRAEEVAEKQAWEASTGHCAECQGTKQQWAGWSNQSGTRYKPCTRCKATGNAPESPCD